MNRIPVDRRWLQELLLILNIKLKHPDRSDEDGALGIKYRTWIRYRQAGSAPDDALCTIIRRSRELADQKDRQDLPKRGENRRTYLLELHLEKLLTNLEFHHRARQVLLENSQRPQTGADIRQIADAIGKPDSLEAEAIRHSRQGKMELAEKMLSGLRSKAAHTAARLWIETGDNYSRNFAAHLAIAPYEEALRYNPDDVSTRLRLATAHLRARVGDAGEHWQAAFTILDNKIGRDQPEWIEWQRWLGLCWFRHPKVPEREKYSTAERLLRAAMNAYKAARLKKHAAATGCDLAILLTLSRNDEKQQEALRLFQQGVRSCNRELEPGEWSQAKKRLGNYWIYRNTKDDESRSRQLKNNALRHYREALEVLVGPSWDVERGLLLYTRGDVYLHLSQCDKKNAAEHCNSAVCEINKSLEYLQPEHGEDYGRAQYNLAQAYHVRPCPTESDLEQAIEAYQRTLDIFHRGYNESEWSETHYPLADAYRLLAAQRPGDLQWLRLAIASAKAACSIADKKHPLMPEFRAQRDKLRRLYESRRSRQDLPYGKIPSAA